jgi:Flp pilus assembly protein TadB
MEGVKPVLRQQYTTPTYAVMSRARPHRSPLVRTLLFVAGLVLIASAPIVGIIPGPGGVLVFAAGLVLVLRNSSRARGRFVRLKRRFPRLGHYIDMALRRQSFRRRRERAREAEIARAEAVMLGFPQDLR